MLLGQGVCCETISVSPSSVVCEKGSAFILGTWTHCFDFFCIWSISISAGKAYEIQEVILFFKLLHWICDPKFTIQPWVIAVKLLVENNLNRLTNLWSGGKVKIWSRVWDCLMLPAGLKYRGKNIFPRFAPVPSLPSTRCNLSFMCPVLN